MSNNIWSNTVQMNSEDSNNCATLPWLEQTRIKLFGCRVKILTLLGGMSPYMYM